MFLLQKYLPDCGARVRAAGSRVPAGAGRVRAHGYCAAAVAGGGGGRLPRQRDGGADDNVVVAAADGLVGGHDLSLSSALGSRFLFSDSCLSHIA